MRLCLNGQAGADGQPYAKKLYDWCITEGLQIIGTTVGDREECQIIIEDGKVKEDRTITLKTKEPIVTALKFSGDFK